MGTILYLIVLAILLFVITGELVAIVADAAGFPFGFISKKLGILDWLEKRRIRKTLLAKPFCPACTRVERAGSGFCTKCGTKLCIAELPVFPKCTGCERVFHLPPHISDNRYHCPDCGTEVSAHLSSEASREQFKYAEFFRTHIDFF